MNLALPVPHSIYERAVLFDSSALKAILDPADQYHQEATQCLTSLRELAYPLFATNLTIAETHRRLLYKPRLGGRQAFDLLEAIYDGSTNIIRPLVEDEIQAIEYIKRFEDQTLSFTDAVNMAVMVRMGLRNVFSFDWHFTLLGFLVLPRYGRIT
jgi:predicted nucleic acid-binding protein